MKILSLLLVALLVASISAQSTRTSMQHTTASLLSAGSVASVKLLPGALLVSENGTSKPYLILRQSLNIHGLWPDGVRGRSVGRFRLDVVEEDPHLFEDMNTFWPPQSTEDQSEYFLWEHEWSKHGKDYVQILKTFGSDLTQDEYQYQFFKDTIDLFTSFNLRNIPKARWSKQELAEYWGLETNQFYTRCNNKGHLNEIRICVKITPGGKEPERCPRISSNCPNANTVVDFFGWEGTTSDL